MNDEMKTVIKRKNDGFFSFAYHLHRLIGDWQPQTIHDLALYTCLNGFCQSAINYALSVAEDVQRLDFQFMPKSMMNRLLLRNCLEAYLILIILHEKPAYSEKYYQTKIDDSERIELLYSNLENERRFLKRFEWLPRFKGRKATSTKDLLKYIDFEDQEEADFIETLIKNLDKFIHPSFHYAQNVDQTETINDVAVIYSLYVDEGLIDELKRNMYNAIKSIKVLPNFHELNRVKYLISDYIQLYKTMANQEVTLGVLAIAKKVRETEFHTHKGRGCVYLLQDLVPRYDDLLQSLYAKNTLLFFIQARYIIEALSTLHILLREDEMRNYVYHIHQNIKNFEAQVSSRAFLQIEDDMRIQNELHISFIKQYYQNRFQVDIDESKITRLSGWALFLNDIQNSEPLNSPNFVAFLGQSVFKTEEDIRRLMVFYEESNAYTHITPYAFCNALLGNSLRDIYALIHQLFIFIIKQIIHEFSLTNHFSSFELNHLFHALNSPIE